MTLVVVPMEDSETALLLLQDMEMAHHLDATGEEVPVAMRATAADVAVLAVEVQSGDDMRPDSVLVRMISSLSSFLCYLLCYLFA